MRMSSSLSLPVATRSDIPDTGTSIQAAPITVAISSHILRFYKYKSSFSDKIISIFICSVFNTTAVPRLKCD